LNSLLAAVEAAPPVAAVDVLAGALAEAIGARCDATSGANRDVRPDQAASA
jgi:hypothetical protein